MPARGRLIAFANRKLRASRLLLGSLTDDLVELHKSDARFGRIRREVVRKA
jgi:hypothetical protein